MGRITKSCFIEESIISANSRIEEITRYVKHHFINKTFNQFIHSHDLDVAITCFVMAKKGKPQNFEAAFSNKEGQYVELNITFLSVTVDYKIVGVYGIGKDITEPKKCFAELKETKDFNTLILESITDGFISVETTIGESPIGIIRRRSSYCYR